MERGSALYEQSVLDRFDQVRRGRDLLPARQLRQFERMNMEAELRRFNMALRDGLAVLPEDF